MESSFSSGPGGVPYLQVSIKGEGPGILADLSSIVGDLRFVAQLCERLAALPEQGQAEFDPVIVRAFWTAAVIYARPFAGGKGYLRRGARLTEIPQAFIDALDEDERSVHAEVLVERDQHVGHRVGDQEQMLVLMFLNPPPQERAVAGVGVLSTHLAARMPDFVATLGRVATKLADRLEAECEAMRRSLMASGAKRLDQLYRDAGADGEPSPVAEGDV